MKATNASVRVEVEDGGAILIVLDRQTDCILMPWQDAYQLAEAILLAVADVRDDLEVIDMPRLLREQAQIRLNVHAGKVALVFDHADRVRYTWRSAEVLAQALKIKAQDVQLEQEKQVRLVLGRNGLLRPVR